MDVVSAHLGVRMEELCGPSRSQQICQARALISYLAAQEFRITGTDVASRLDVDRSSVSRAIKRQFRRFFINRLQLLHTIRDREE